MLKADLHIHTKYSMDCNSNLEDIISRCLKVGINCIAIADHGNIEGALQLQNMAPFKVIIAEEILTPKGEIMGMFLKESIPSGLSLDEAIRRIKAQNGLINVPHPFDNFRGSGLGNHIEEISDRVDVVEVFNARSPFPWGQSRARAFADKYNLPASAGSDAHTINEIGKTFIEMPTFDDSNGFLESLAKGEIHGHRTNPLCHFRSLWARLNKQ